jgi:hypothetical protein
MKDARFSAGFRRPPAYAIGDVVGPLRILDGGDASAYADHRRVRVVCAVCGYRQTLRERSVRVYAKHRRAGCAFCWAGRGLSI